jgi:CDP-glucose 4,6-dehydratase
MEEYRDKRVLITGHTGFKGGWLCAILKHFGAIIKGYSLAPVYSGGIYSVLLGDSLCESVIEDIRDRKSLMKEILSFEPDFIFHLAAQSLVRPSYQLPSETFEVNIMGTSYLLESLLSLKKKCTVIVVTSDKVYKNIEQDILYTEEDSLGGHDPYSASKASAEIIVDSYRRSFFSPLTFSMHQKALATARAGNVIGGGDYAVDRIIPDLIRALQKKEKVRIRNPDAIRPWQHVLEPLWGYLRLGLLLDKDPVKYSKAYNFGPNLKDQLTVLELVQMALEFWGEGSYEIFRGDKLHEAKILLLNNELAKQELEWVPHLSSRLAIEKTIKWYMSFNQFEESFKQIREYQELYEIS